MELFWVRGGADEVVASVADWLSADPAPPAVVETSGSTGAPKRVVLPRAAVLASVRASAERLGATGPWVLALPATFVAGLQVVVRSLVAGHRPTLLERDGWPEGEGWFVSLVPTQLRRMLTDPVDVAALRRAHTVLLGGGPIGASLRESAERAGVHVVATYGSAETAGGCVYDGVPLDGVAVALGEGGRIRIAGPTLFTGYDGDPTATAEVLRDGWFQTSDAGRIDADGRLEVIGRVDDVIVSGGLNVPGPAVAERLRTHPGLAAAEVLGVPDPEWGRRVVAFVVPAPPGPAPGLEELRDWVGATEPRAWAPRSLVVLDDIPLLGNGKPDRQALLALAGQQVRP
ncbi:AMP-binding protein [Nocardioides sp. zg-536]|uniref:AMP-binding protein n=1 Tax=Nocardioides faecalis TaxID=2803858 RepID=A0A938Y3C1_9ACTN|nr:AMP-binding protein [Nocardioides faecalis]MBM9461101.1 AMP-binding protein [Nocardioides faecalis]MBS4751994.1 AMP-binding protein [Nocardioides faecalis]QVI59180.1 AMP-binding protein [Nocardioides faecalis]